MDNLNQLRYKLNQIVVGRRARSDLQSIVFDILSISSDISERYYYVDSANLVRENVKSGSTSVDIELLINALKILEKYGKNLLRNDRPPQWRVVRWSNPVFHEHVDNIQSSRDILKQMGYTDPVYDGVSFPTGVHQPNRDLVAKVTCDIVLLKFELLFYQKKQHPKSRWITQCIELQNLCSKSTTLNVSKEVAEVDEQPHTSKWRSPFSSTMDDFCAVCGQTFSEFYCPICKMKQCATCDKKWHMNRSREAHQRTPLRPVLNSSSSHSINDQQLSNSLQSHVSPVRPPDFNPLNSNSHQSHVFRSDTSTNFVDNAYPSLSLQTRSKDINEATPAANLTSLPSKKNETPQNWEEKFELVKGKIFSLTDFEQKQSILDNFCEEVDKQVQLEMEKANGLDHMPSVKQHFLEKGESLNQRKLELCRLFKNLQAKNDMTDQLTNETSSLSTITTPFELQYSFEKHPFPLTQGFGSASAEIDSSKSLSFYNFHGNVDSGSNSVANKLNNPFENAESTLDNKTNHSFTNVNALASQPNCPWACASNTLTHDTNPAYAKAENTFGNDPNYFLANSEDALAIKENSSFADLIKTPAHKTNYPIVNTSKIGLLPNQLFASVKSTPSPKPIGTGMLVNVENMPTCKPSQLYGNAFDDKRNQAFENDFPDNTYQPFDNFQNELADKPCQPFGNTLVDQQNQLFTNVETEDERLHKEMLRLNSLKLIDEIREAESKKLTPIEIRIHLETTAKLSGYHDSNLAAVSQDCRIQIEKLVEKYPSVSFQEAAEIFLQNIRDGDSVEKFIEFKHCCKMKSVQSQLFSPQQLEESLKRNGGDFSKALVEVQKPLLQNFTSRFKEYSNYPGKFTVKNVLEINDRHHLKNIMVATFHIKDVTIADMMCSILFQEFELTDERSELCEMIKDYDVQDVYEASKSFPENIELALKYLSRKCQLCLDMFPQNKVECMTACGDNDCSYCQDCLAKYLEMKIREGHVRDLVCPVCKLPDINIDDEVSTTHFTYLDAVVKKYLNEKTLSVYQKKQRDHTLMTMSNFRWCSYCENGFVYEDNRLKMSCPACHKATCYSCKKRWEDQHEGLSCQEFFEWKQMNDVDFQNEGLARHLKENGINCPHCKFRYELAKGGCMHFKCPMCSYQFCSGCKNPFRPGQACNVLKDCSKQGFHAHHPRDCLFYLRDLEVDRLQKILSDANIEINYKVETKHQDGFCQVLEQKEASDGLVDAACGREVVSDTGLCTLHYKEYLVNLVNDNHLDPAHVFTISELETCLQRSERPITSRVSHQSDEEYRDLLLRFVKQMPLMHQQNSSQEKAIPNQQRPLSRVN